MSSHALERAPAATIPAWALPRYANPLIDWLLSDGWNIVDSGMLLKALAIRMLAMGLDVWRMRMTLRTLHPQVIGISYTWVRGKGDVEIFEAPHSILQSNEYLNSPFAAIFEGAGGVRRRLDSPDAILDYGVLIDLKAQGATDYVAMLLTFSDGKISAITFATQRPGGFCSDELTWINDMLPVFTRLVEVHAMRRAAKTLLDTYLGPHTGERVLNGHIRRGDGEDIAAVIWFCDLRNSTDGLPACLDRARRHWPWSLGGACLTWVIRPMCSTATTSGMGCVATSGSRQRTEPRISGVSAKWRRYSPMPATSS